ncbi:MAG: hypothetical protein JXR25_14060 [Pontiellaceae bacterium]|nr:hypothetical protein [Pontiellaceae bacterium]
MAEDNKLKSGRNELVISTTDDAPLFYDATWHYLSHENPITAETCELVSITRAYYRVDSATGKFSKAPMAEGEILHAGETIRVELKLHAAQQLEYVLAQDFKPAGFECTDISSGYRNDGIPHYRELHDERVDCYITHVPKGESSIVYDLRAEHAGNVCAMPARTELMYAPDQAANTREQQIKVQR